jgi:hypothetical protein
VSVVGSCLIEREDEMLVLVIRVGGSLTRVLCSSHSFLRIEVSCILVRSRLRGVRMRRKVWKFNITCLIDLCTDHRQPKKDESIISMEVLE